MIAACKTTANLSNERGRVFGYVRLPTAEQEDSGKIRTQREQISAHVAAIGLGTLDRLFVDISGGHLPLAERPEGGLMMANLRSGDTVVALRLGRMFCSGQDAAQVVERFRDIGISLHLVDLGGEVTGNDTGRIFLIMAAGFAEMERERLRERVTEGKRRALAEGRHGGGAAPAGTRLERDPQGRIVVLLDTNVFLETHRILAEGISKGRSLRTMADDLKAHGVKASHVTVKKLLIRHGLTPVKK
ncbi:recombinase family protein [Skermanella pratensis]|uniref:recombinase family protein n=1 Tax=Skermanella pratensis TaxID=2233999 RepID=UPI001301793E